MKTAFGKPQSQKRQHQFGLMLAGLLVAAATSFAHAEKMDAEIHTVVIQKLEQVLAKGDASVDLKPVRARLADLYADRARLRAMNEAEANCQNCTGALEDRKRALKLYERVLSESDKSSRGALILQMAQLEELDGQMTKSQQLYNRIVTEGERAHGPSIMSEALIGRAEGYFAKGDMDRAEKDFKRAADLVGPGRKGQIIHRIAWCQLNRGEQVLAVRTLVHILETPDLLTRNSSEGTVYDASFHEDLSRDLGTFFARGEVGHREIALLESLSPEKSRAEIMQHLATECDRLGQKKSAIAAWIAVSNYDQSPAEMLEIKARIAQLEYELGEKPQALARLKDVAETWRKHGCDDTDKCALVQKRMRALVVSWNKAEKRQPSALLSDAYVLYVGAFPEDMEMTEWAAEVARAEKRFAVAAVLYHKSAMLAAAAIAAPKGSAPETKKDREKVKIILEQGLVGEVEMSELSKDPRTREISYDHYIELNPNGAIINKIRYQRAHLAYERGDLNEASVRFHAFAVSKNCGTLCVPAADLDLDALVGLKAHAVVQARATEYARVFPARRNEYLKIARTAVLKQAEGQAPQAAIAKLAEADLTGANTEERVRFLKTWLAQAEKAQDLDGTRAASENLLATKGLSSADRELALAKLAWVAETKLDFETAFQTVKKMKSTTQSSEERALRLSLLAELAGRDARPYDQQLLRLTRDPKRQALIRAKLVREAKNPGLELAQQEKSLRPYPSIYAPLALEVFAKTGKVEVAQAAVRSKGVLKERAGRVLQSELLIRSFAEIDTALAHHQLQVKSERGLQKSLVQRLQLLSRAETVANRSIASHDWISQILSLTLLARENQRLSSELLALPVPEQLKGQERAQYTQLLANQARSYQHKYETINRKVTLLWGQTEKQTAIETDMKTAPSAPVRALVANELRRLMYVAPGGIRRQLDEELSQQNRVPSEEQIRQAREQAKNRPFNAQTLNQLRELELVRGRETMVAYLDARLLKLKTGEKR